MARCDLGHRREEGRNLFGNATLSPTPWLASKRSVDILINKRSDESGPRDCYGLSFRTGRTEHLMNVQVGVPSSSPDIPRACATFINGFPADASCRDFSMTLVVPGADLYWTVVPPLEFLWYLCSLVRDRAARLFSPDVASAVRIVPIVIFPEKAYLPTKWSVSYSVGRYKPEYSPSPADMERITAHGLQLPFTIDTERGENNFLIGIGAGFDHSISVETDLRTDIANAIHSMVRSEVECLPRVNEIEVPLAGGGRGLLYVASGSKGLAASVKDIGNRHVVITSDHPAYSKTKRCAHGQRYGGAARPNAVTQHG